MNDLTKLIERLENATGPDRGLGREVLLACGWRTYGVGCFIGPLIQWHSPDQNTTFGDDDFYRHDPTSSIDAALTLVEGRLWKAGVSADGTGYARVGPPRIYEGKTPAIALCIGALRARASNSD